MGRYRRKAQGGIAEKIFQVDCGSTEQCVALLEKIDEELSSHAEVYAEIKGSKIIFRIIGFEPEVQKTVINLREIIALYKSLPRKAVHGVTPEQLSKIVKKSVPLDLLAKILRFHGVRAEVKNNVLYADIELDRLAEIARDLGEALEKVSKIPLGSGLRKLVAAATYLTGRSPSEILRVLRELGIVNEDFELLKPWSEALDQLLEYIGESHEEF